MTSENGFENVEPRPRFAVGMRGYDRAQVDAYIADSARWAAEAWGRIVHLEDRMSELEGGEAPRLVREDTDRTVDDARRTVDRFVEKVDAKAAELEEAVVKEARPQLDELRQHVEELEDERRSALAELDVLRESLNDLVRDIYGDGGRASEPDAARLDPESGSLATAAIVGDFRDQ
jgi:cell division septum initiation protein DivIVA